jgi:hypothetical protein
MRTPRKALARAVQPSIGDTSRAMHAPDLFGTPDLASRGGHRDGAGRPKGSRNKRTGEMARFYMRQMHTVDPGFADPLLRALAIAGKNILDQDEVAELARIWGCEPAKAVELYLANWRAVMPYIHQEQPRSLHFAPGAPESEELAPTDGELPVFEGTFERMPS